MKNIKLTYLTSTYNKLPFLKERLSSLINNRKENEEILVADGGSTDGTKEFLKSLNEENKIDYFISEKDRGESEALNKLFLLAKGELMTLVTDDDIRHYPSIQKCKDFMLEHKEIDLLGSNGGFKNQYLDNTVRPLNYTSDFKEWMELSKPFGFCGLGLMIRKSSLPILGLWNPSFRRADAEYSLRVTSGHANIAWFTSPTYVNISNPQSVSLVYQEKIKNETNRLNKFYLNKNKDLYIIEKLKIIQNKLKNPKINKSASQKNDFIEDWQELVQISENWLNKENENNGEFLYKK